MTEPSDALKDLVSGLGPHKRLGMPVGAFDISADGHLEFAGAEMNTATQLLLGQRGEPAFDEVDPRGARRREVQMEARMADQPAMDRRGLVCAGVVENQVDVEGGGHLRVDGI